MSRASVLARGRSAAESGMVDTCRIETRTGETTDPFSGAVTGQYSSFYEGKCRFQQTQAQAEQRDTGEAYLLLQNVELQLPISVTGVQPGDRVTVLTSRDEDLVDRVLVVRDLAYKTDATSRRLRVQEVTS